VSLVSTALAPRRASRAVDVSGGRCTAGYDPCRQPGLGRRFRCWRGHVRDGYLCPEHEGHSLFCRECFTHGGERVPLDVAS
jgi:hypothetical protein